MALQVLRAAAYVAAAVALGGAGWVDPTPAPPPVSPAPQSAPLEVTGWSLNHGRLTVTVHGNSAALDRLRSEGRLAIQVHWVRDGAGDAAGASELTTELPVGRPGLVSALAGEVQHQGYFAWHSWAWKRASSHGAWTVSLTYPDGSPVVCAPQQQPCRLSSNGG